MTTCPTCNQPITPRPWRKSSNGTVFAVVVCCEIANYIEVEMTDKENARECVESDWTGLYGQSWRGLIVNDAFAH